MRTKNKSWLAVEMLLILAIALVPVVLSGAFATDGIVAFRYSSADSDFDATKKRTDFAYVQGDSVELIVGLREAVPDSIAKLMTIATQYGGEIVDTISIEDRIMAAVVNVTWEASSSFKAKVKSSGLSEYIEPNWMFKALMVPNDPYWTVQWGPKMIEADYAWNTTTGSNSVLVAVIDSGIDHNHPDLAANYAPLGYDFVNDDDDPMDDMGHGTHCAGIIAAEINNNEGIAGLAQVRIMAERVLDESGYGTSAGIAKGIIHASYYGADIISMSIGDFFTVKQCIMP